MVNQLDKELIKKNKPYQKKKSRIKRNLILIFVMLTYIFFFTSTLFFPEQITKSTEVTKPGMIIDFAENRSATLINAVYSKEQQMMEIVMHFENKNYDNVNDYYYALELLGCKTKGITIREVYNEDLFTVLRIEDLQKGYAEMTLYYAPKTVAENQVTDAITGQFTLNKHNVQQGRIDLRKDKLTYLAERLDSVIKSYKDILTAQEKELKEYQATTIALEAENQKVAQNSPYLTQKELEEKQLLAQANEDALVEMREDIKMQQQKIQYTKKEIAAATEKRNLLK